MNLSHLVVGMLSTNCYVISCSKTNIGAVIDPGDEGENIIEQCQKHQVNCQYIILTHGHHDHIGAVVDVKRATGARVLIHQNDADKLAIPPRSLFLNAGFKTLGKADGYVEDGDTITVGELELKVIHTPGHTPGGICLGVDEILFTGDTLFYGSVGRSDLPGGDHGQLVNAIKTKLLTWPDATKVYPGHGPGSTIGMEKQINPFLR